MAGSRYTAPPGTRFVTAQKRCYYGKGVREITKVEIDRDPLAREAMIACTGQRSVPKIFIDDTHIGGCNDLTALEQADGFDTFFAARLLHAARHVIKPAAADALTYSSVRNLLPSATT